MNESEFEELLEHEKAADVIQELRNEKDIPLILWGAGEVAVAVKKYLKQNNIFPVAVWIDGKKEKAVFEELPVMSLNEIKEKYKIFNVFLGHSKYDLGEIILERESQVNRVFYLVSVLYEQYRTIEYNSIKKYLHKYFAIYQLLQDRKSKKSLIAYLNSRMTNNIAYIRECVEKEQNYFENDIFQIGCDEDYVDVGAFNGDSIKLFLDKSQGKYNSISAIEPDKENYRVLKQYVNQAKVEGINLYNIGTWNECKCLSFQEEGEQKSSIQLAEGNSKVQVDTLDNILEGKKVSIIKINFFIGVLETLEGALNTLILYKPKLAITVGFDEWAMIEILGFLNRNIPEYKLYLRYNRCMPACLMLYAMC